MSSIREHLQSIRDRHKPVDRLDVYGFVSGGVDCGECAHFTSWPCATREDAVAALAQLQAGETWWVDGRDSHNLALVLVDRQRHQHDQRYLLVPDPLVPRLDATVAPPTLADLPPKPERHSFRVSRLDANPNTKEDT